MRSDIVAIGLLFLSCNDTTQHHLSKNEQDSIVSVDTLKGNIDSLPETNMPIIFSIEGLSSEGSEVKARYINDTIKEAQWDIFGETGRTTIKYSFL